MLVEKERDRGVDDDKAKEGKEVAAQNEEKPRVEEVGEDPIKTEADKKKIIKEKFFVEKELNNTANISKPFYIYEDFFDARPEVGHDGISISEVDPNGKFITVRNFRQTDVINRNFIWKYFHCIVTSFIVSVEEAGQTRIGQRGFHWILGRTCDCGTDDV